MKTVTIPTCANPFVVIINGKKYSYPAGATMEVPDEVAEVIERHEEAHPKPEPDPAPSEGGGLPVVVLTTPIERETETFLSAEESAALSAAYALNTPIIIHANYGGSDIAIPFSRYNVDGAIGAYLGDVNFIGDPISFTLVDTGDGWVFVVMTNSAGGGDVKVIDLTTYFGVPNVGGEQVSYNDFFLQLYAQQKAGSVLIDKSTFWEDVNTNNTLKFICDASILQEGLTLECMANTISKENGEVTMIEYTIFVIAGFYQLQKITTIIAKQDSNTGDGVETQFIVLPQTVALE